MLKKCFYIWCSLALSMLPRDVRAEDRTTDAFTDAFGVLIFLDDARCVGSAAVENMRVDSENFPVHFLTLPFESGATAAAPSSSPSDSDTDGVSAGESAMRQQKVSEAGAHAGLWFHCGSGTVYLTARAGNTWLDQQRRIEVENDQLNAEGLSAVVHGWLDALIPQWQKADSVVSFGSAAVSKPAAPPKKMQVETGTKKMPSAGSVDTPKESVTPEKVEKTETDQRPGPESEAKQKTPEDPLSKPKAPPETAGNEADNAPPQEIAEERTQRLPEARHRFALEGCVTGVIAGDSIYVGGGTLFFELRPRRGPLEIYLKGSILGKMGFDNAPLNLKVRPWPFGLGARWAWIFRRSALAAGVGLEGVVNQYVTSADDDSIQKGASFQLSVVPMLGATIRVFRIGYIAFRLGTRVVVYRPVYTARVDGEMHRFHGTPLLQPMGYIGVGFDFL